MYSIAGLQRIDPRDMIRGNAYVCNSDFSYNVVVFDRIDFWGGDDEGSVWGDWYSHPDNAHRRVFCGASACTMPVRLEYYSLVKLPKVKKGFGAFIQRVEGTISG